MILTSNKRIDPHSIISNKKGAISIMNKKESLKRSYSKFLKTKGINNNMSGFKPLWMPDFLYDFQKELVDWSIQKGRSALFEDCGLGKTPQQLVWAQNIIQKTNGNVLILTPLAVSYQTGREAEKFELKSNRSQDGTVYKGINITNYERLKYFDPNDFDGVVCDESSILKNFDGKLRSSITEFMNKVNYRLLCTATPAPNDFVELGTSSEALGSMTRNQMLGMFFTHDGKTSSQWNLKGHAKKRFWQWVSIWARALRKPSDLGFDDDGFILPPLNFHRHIVKSNYKENCLLPSAAIGLDEQRLEKRRTLLLRCEKVASLVSTDKSCLIWCHLNTEGDLLEKIIPDAIQVSGSNSDEDKENRLIGFSKGDIRVLITKPKIGGFGMNWQHCSEMTFFPSHSHEQFYQASRRCWRFGQKNEVNCHLVASNRESIIMHNMIRKERQSIEMYDGIIQEMSEFQLGKKESKTKTKKMEVPKWL